MKGLLALSAEQAAKRPVSGRWKAALRAFGPQPALLIAIAVAMVAGLLALHVRIEQTIGRTGDVMARDAAATTAVLAVRDAMMDAESGQQSYLLTMRPADLTLYFDNKSELTSALTRLDGAAAGRPEWLPDVHALQDLALAAIGDLDRGIEVARTGGRDAAVAVGRTRFDQATMTAVRRQIELMARNIVAANAAQLADLQQRRRLYSIAATATSIVGLLLLGGATLLLRGRDRSDENEQTQPALLSATIAQLHDGLAVFDAGKRLLFWNGAMARLAFGRPGDQEDGGGGPLRIGATMDEVMRAASAGVAQPSDLASLLRATPSPGEPLQADIRVGARVFELRRTLLPDGGETLLVADITRRIDAEAIARQAQKMEALGQLTGGVAHDFNNLLQVVSANLELVAPRVRDQAMVAAWIAAASAAVSRAAGLTRHLLAFARRQPLAPQAIDPRRLLAGIEDMLRRTLGGDVALELVLGAGLWPVRADPQQLESAILNLTLNARDAMPGGGRLTVEAANVWLDQDEAHKADVSPGQYVILSVADTGAGMAATELARAVEPFYTTKADGRGSGLGLSMVYGFAKQSGGQFQLNSEPGQGTIARLYLQRSLGEPGLSLQPDEPLGRANGELVLVVEDDMIVRAAACQALRDIGYRTLEAGSAAAALALLRGGARPDLLFTDVVMPGEPGAHTLAQEAERLVPGLTVVFTSGYAESAVVPKGAVDTDIVLVSKPWRIADLSRQLRDARDARRPDPNSAAAVSPQDPARLRIVVVEDERVVRLVMADLLADLGHEVVAAETGAEALAALQQGADLLVTDIGLPDIDGVDLAEQARRVQPGLRVVFATGRGVAGNDNSAIWLAKPYDEADVRRAIDLAMAGRT